MSGSLNALLKGHLHVCLKVFETEVRFDHLRALFSNPLLVVCKMHRVDGVDIKLLMCQTLLLGCKRP